MPPPPSTVILAYYKMEEASGASRLDATGNGHTAVPNGPNTILQSAGRVGFGAEFPIGLPSSSYLEVADAAAFHLGNHDQTWWGWYKPNDFLAGNTLLTKASQVNFQAFRSTGHDWLENYDVYYSSGSAFGRMGYGYTWTAATWQFWMVEYIAATKTANLYRNGVAAPVSTVVLAFAATDSTSPIQMGASSSATAGHTMTLDEVGIANVVFSQGEKDCIYNSGSGGTYPYFCAEAGMAFEGYAARLLSGTDYSAAAYGTKTYFIIPGPVANQERKITVPFVDWNGAQPGDKVALKIERDGDDPNDASTNACALETVTIDYYTKVNP